MSSKQHLFSLMMLLSATASFAGGPLTLHDAATRTPNAYPDSVNVFTDLGANGILTNDESDSLVHKAFAEWNGVSTSSFTGVVGGEILVGGMPTDITSANAGSIIGTFNDGGIHIIYDHDGGVLLNFFGVDPFSIAGVAAPEYTETASPELIESWVVINGTLVDPADSVGFRGSTYMGVYTHEIGHAINLAHTQTNGSMIFPPGDDLGPGGCPPLSGTPSISDTETMFPFIDIAPTSTGQYQATVTHPDDIAALSSISPAPGFPASRGTITGKILMPDGTSEVTGVNVIARNLTDPLGDAVSAISGDFTQGAVGPDGLYTLNGLTPGQQYVVYVDKIIGDNAQAYPTPAAGIQFPEEYFNGANESGDVNADTTCLYTAITAVAGVPATADILLNIDPNILPLTNVDPIHVPLPFSFSFCGTAYDSVWVDPDGFLTFGAPDFLTSIDAAALLNGPPRLTGCWTDLAPADGGFVTASEVGGNFVVTYNQVPEYLFGTINTFTITLRPDGTHRVDMANVGAVIATMVGRSPGGGAADPGETDLSLAAQPLGASAETVYEAWGFLESTDLSNMSLEYAPCGTVVGIEQPGLKPASFVLLQSSPNPFRSSTTIAFDLPEDGPVDLQVFDVRGRLIRTMVDTDLVAGSYAYPWRGADNLGRQVRPGVYFYRLKTPGFEATRKTILVQ